MTDVLGIVHVEDLEDFARLRARLYRQYGVSDILGQNDFDFPEPLEAHEICPEFGNYDRNLMHHLLGESARRLLPFIEQALEARYKNNPIFDGAVDRESLAQIVNQVYAAARAAGIEIGGARIESYEKSQCCHLIRTLINALVLTELLAWRKQ